MKDTLTVLIENIHSRANQKKAKSNPDPRASCLGSIHYYLDPGCPSFLGFFPTNL